jgi:hypothetical protein
MAAQMVDIQPLKRALGGNIYLASYIILYPKNVILFLENDVIFIDNDVSDWSISFVTSYLIGQSFCISDGSPEVRHSAA